MPEQQGIADLVAERVRARRRELGWSLDELAGRARISASTISRLETGRRRIGLDQLVPLADALGITLDELVSPTPELDVVIRPSPRKIDGMTVWPLERHHRPGLPSVFKLELPASRRCRAPASHPGREWLYVLDGTLELALGDRRLLVRAGETADFDTATPHSLGAVDGPVAMLVIYDDHAERAHLQR